MFFGELLRAELLNRKHLPPLASSSLAASCDAVVLELRGTLGLHVLGCEVRLRPCLVSLALSAHVRDGR